MSAEIIPFPRTPEQAKAQLIAMADRILYEACLLHDASVKLALAAIKMQVDVLKSLRDHRL